MEAVADRVRRIMGDGEAIDVDITDGESLPRLKLNQPWPVIFPGNGARGQPGDVNRDTESSGEQYQSRDVVGMFMRYQHGIQPPGIFSNRGEPLKGGFPAQTGIDKDPGAAGPDERGVSRTAAGKNTGPDDDCLLGTGDEFFPELSW